MNSRTPDDLSRRSALGALATLAAGGAALTAGCKAHAQSAPHGATSATASGPSATVPPAFGGAHTVAPLPFAPTALQGISERMIVSHHDNNYAGAVRNLNRTEQELAGITAETPPFLVAALRDRELTFRNSMTLHEAYFANLGGDGKRAGAVETALAQAYGTSGAWEAQFRATGAGLGGGSGWVVLALELETGALRTVGMAGHAQSLALGAPLLVMDMYEHAYQMDFGAAVPRYLDAFFANVKWDEVNARFARAQRASAALRGA